MPFILPSCLTYDFSRPSTSNGISIADGKIDSVKIQIQEVTHVMRDNVMKVMERGERLEDLQDASDRLTIAGNQFREAAKKAQRRAWLQNVKSRIIIVSITLTIVFFIFWTSWRFTWFSDSKHPIEWYSYPLLSSIRDLNIFKNEQSQSMSQTQTLSLYLSFAELSVPFKIDLY
ncbi:synaptobrevin 1-like isoform X1 [Vespula squamosa]|uniref:Synaptobrevin 1-like isoform X1 n=1 Tax=Vespula squamosa TaxID=30214 RepID=A0ABD2BM42_VESSQ